MELSEDTALHVDATDTHGLAQTLAAVANAPESFAGLRERALSRAREFSWRRTAERTVEVYATARRIFRQ
jgi:glycosyltransferase involved in cell wall biosynthesis